MMRKQRIASLFLMVSLVALTGCSLTGNKESVRSKEEPHYIFDVLSVVDLTYGTEEYLFDYSVDIKEKDIAKALGDGGLSWSNQVTDGLGTIKSWGMIFYQRDMMNRYLVTRMVANCRNNEVRRYSIENQDIICGVLPIRNA